MGETKLEKKRRLILSGNLWQILLLISLPVAVSSMVIEIFNLFDIYFSSSIGQTEMAATVFVGPINNVVNAASVGLGVAATALIAKEIGKHDFKNARLHYAELFLITLVAGVLLFLICFFFSIPILKASGAKDDLLTVSNWYFRIIIISLPFRCFNDIYIGMQRAVGNNRHIMIVNITSIVLKFISSYLLIIVFKKGIIGLGISTIIATLYITLFAIYNTFIKNSELRLTFGDFKINWRVIGAIILCALPIIIEKSTQSFGNLVINKYATDLGEEVLNAYGVTNRINSIIFSFSSGFGVALITVVGQNLVCENYSRIKEAKIKGVILSLGVVVPLLCIVLGFSPLIAGAFSSGSESLKNKIITAMSIYTISAIPWTIMHIYFGIFQGYKKTIYALIVSMVRLWIFRVFLVGLLLKFTNMGEYAIWYGMLISNILAMICSYIIYFVAPDFKTLRKAKANFRIKKVEEN